MGNVIILPETPKDPISLIGRRAAVCWGGDIFDNSTAYQRGINCIKANHGRTLEYVDVHMVFEGYSAKVIREWYTHIGGSPTRLQESTRYVDSKNFQYVIPPKIFNNPEAAKIYTATMKAISDGIVALENLGIEREDSSMLCPLGMETKIVDKRNVRNLMDMSRQRECKRAFWEYRDSLWRDIKSNLSIYSEEWETLVGMIFFPKCEMLGYCPEGSKCCGRKGNIKVDYSVDLAKED